MSSPSTVGAVVLMEISPALTEAVATAKPAIAASMKVGAVFLWFIFGIWGNMVPAGQ
jgi:hypothetical protein